MPDATSVGPSAQSIPVPHGDWTADLLYIHLSSKLEDLKAHIGDLRTADAIALNAALTSAKMAVDKALESSQRATDKAERANEQWRAASNEWREAMDDRESRFLTVEAYNAAHTPLIKDIADLRSFRDTAVGRQAAMTALVGFIFAAITIALRFI